MEVANGIHEALVWIGVTLQIPTIGVFKNFSNIGSGHNRKDVVQQAQEECKNVGDVIILDHEFSDGFKVKCAVMRTTDRTPFRLVFMSVGNLIDLESCIEVMKKVCHYREPEPVRLADKISREYIRNQNAAI